METKHSRRERRIIEEANRKAKIVYNGFTDRFVDFFSTVGNPDGDEVLNKINQFDAQWRTYCRVMGLKDEAKGIVFEFCKRVIDEYIAEKSKLEEEVKDIQA